MARKSRPKSPLAMLPMKVAAPPPNVRVFSGTQPRSISREEIYHRLEWYFEKSHDPHGQHSIAPTAPISALLHGLSLSDLYVNINKASQTYYPAWTSLLFHGVQIPWISAPDSAIGIKDIKTFGDLVNCLVLSYRHAGWQVSDT
jgi:hypothetical protein